MRGAQRRRFCELQWCTSVAKITFMSDQHPIDVYPRVFAIWDQMTCLDIHVDCSTILLARHWSGVPLQLRHNECDGVSNHQPHYCLLNRLFRRRSKKISKLRITGLCDGNLPVSAEFPAQMASNAEYASIWWRHHVGLGNTRNYLGCGTKWYPCGWDKWNFAVGYII